MGCATLQQICVRVNFPSNKAFAFGPITTYSDSFCRIRSSHSDIWKHTYINSMLSIFCHIRITLGFCVILHDRKWWVQKSTWMMGRTNANVFPLPVGAEQHTSDGRYPAGPIRWPVRWPPSSSSITSLCTGEKKEILPHYNKYNTGNTSSYPIIKAKAT